jgi:biopolymer transport protein ExbB
MRRWRWLVWLGSCGLAGALNGEDSAQAFNLQSAFWEAPWVYALLIGVALASIGLCMHNFATVRYEEMLPQGLANELHDLLLAQRCESAVLLCQNSEGLLACLLERALHARRHGFQVMLEALQQEGRLAGSRLWQRIEIFNDLAVLAPLLGLLGTLISLCMVFFQQAEGQLAFQMVMDGVSLALGTTVAGLFVALLSMTFYTILRLRMSRLLCQVETESLALLNLLDGHAHEAGVPA